MYEMTRERFADLAEAYGGQIARWPEPEREAAAVLLAAEPDFADGVLAQASGLDDALAQWAPQPVRAELRAAVISAAPRAAPVSSETDAAQDSLKLEHFLRRTGGHFGGKCSRPRRSLWSWAMGLGLGAGLAGACASGVVAGALLLGALADPGGEALTAAMTSSDTLGVDPAGLTGDV